MSLQQSPGHGEIEDELQPIPEANRTRKLSGQFWIWAGANVAPINWILGALGISWASAWPTPSSC